LVLSYISLIYHVDTKHAILIQKPALYLLLEQCKVYFSFVLCTLTRGLSKKSKTMREQSMAGSDPRKRNTEIETREDIMKR